MPLLNHHKPHNHFNGLDHLRAFAITIVFLYHYSGIFPHPEWVRTISQFGWTGVDLFFVLSGYLISSQLFSQITKGQKLSFKKFFLKRFFRIIPAYLFVVTLYFLLPFVREREAPAPLWMYLTFTQNIGLDLSRQGTFSHAWSLCIEEQFYLFLPLILIALVQMKILQKGKLILALLFLFCFLIRLYSWCTLVAPFEENDDFGIRWYKWIYYPTWCRLDGLLTGISIAAVFQFRPKLKRILQQYGNGLLITGLSLFVAAYSICKEQLSFSASVWGFPLVALAYGGIVAGAVSPTSILYKLPSKITGKIATLSYGIYLTHKIVIHITQQQFSRLNISQDGNLMFLLCIATSLLAAIALNKIIEKPFLKLRTRFLPLVNNQ